MSVYTKEMISDLLFQKIDSIIIVDAEKDTYRTVKSKASLKNLLKTKEAIKVLLKNSGLSLMAVRKKSLMITMYLFQ